LEKAGIESESIVCVFEHIPTDVPSVARLCEEEYVYLANRLSYDDLTMLCANYFQPFFK